MGEVIYFDICAIPVYIIVIATTLHRRMWVGRSNRLYLEVALFALAADLSEVAATLLFCGGESHPIPLVWVQVCHYLYFITRHGLNVAFLFFVIAMTKTWFKIRKLWIRILIMMPYWTLLVMMVLNLKTGCVFSVTSEQGYARGPYMYVLYLLAFCYMAFGLLHLLLHRYTLDAISWLALFSMYFINVACVLFQYFYPRYLIESFATSLTVLFVVLYVKRPERQVDINTGLPGYRAFCDEIGKIKVTGHDTQVVIVSLRNAAEMSSYLRESYLSYLHIIDDQIRSYARQEHVDCELYFEQPGNFYLILEDATYNPVQAIPEIRDRVRRSSAEILESGVQPDTHIVTVTFPKEIDSPDELLRFGHNFVRFADYSRVFSRASAITEQRAYQIEAHIDEILGRAITADGVKLRYQPIYSAEAGGFTAVEAVIELTDEVYGDIDAELLLRAAEEHGLSVSVGGRILEEAFSFAGSETMRRLGYSRIYIGLSVMQCMRLDLTDTIWSLRERAHVSPEQIAFAIRNPFFGNMSSAYSENLKKLTAQGYTIVLDGFGHGYSDIRSLTDMPIKAVRLDKSMVATAGARGGRALIGGMIEMVRQIPLEVMAAGADDQETAEMLCSMGCSLLQGHYYADPADRETLSENGD